MLKTTSKVQRESQASEHRPSSSRRGKEAPKTVWDHLAKTVPAQETWMVSSLPRGALQIVQPAKITPSLLRAYNHKFHVDDRASWRAIVAKRAMRGADCWPNGEFENSRFFQDFMKSADLEYLAVAPVASPVFEGFAGALCLYRTAEQGDFSADDLKRIAAAAEQLAEQAEKNRLSRRTDSCAAPQAWSHKPATRQWAFDSKARSLLGEAPSVSLEDRLPEQIVQYVKKRMARADALAEAGERLTLSDARGDLWVFHAIGYKRYPALVDGPAVFVCLQPDSCDWNLLRAADIQADSELSRMAPAMQFMQAEYHRGATLNEIARTVDLSPFHFHRRFTELLGITPKHFLLESQIHEAKLQLMSGKMELVEIARSCGFAHQSHFTSRFKQATGLTPTRWRRMAKRLEGAADGG